MTLTAQERAAINRQNAKRSTGPTSQAGKNATRRNSFKHGMRATIVSLPGEDPTVVTARETAWNDHYQPKSPAAQHLVNECVRATLLSDRIDLYQTAVVSEQIRSATADLVHDDETRLLELKTLMNTDPAAALLGLRRFAMGCRDLIARWEVLGERIDRPKGLWSVDERDEAVRLLGHRPDALQKSPDAWVVCLYTAVLHPTPSLSHLNWLCSSEQMPDSQRRHFSPTRYPEADVARECLQDMVAANLEDLRARELALRTDIEDPSHAEAGARALLIQNPVSARLFLRYHAEARTGFHRAYSELLKTLALDAAEAEDEAVADVADTNSPNEANLDGKAGVERASEVGSGDAGAVSEGCAEVDEGFPGVTDVLAGIPGPFAGVEACLCETLR